MTTVVPSGKIEAEAGAHTGTIAPSTRSVAVALKVTTAPAGVTAFAPIDAGRRPREEHQQACEDRGDDA